MRDIRGGAVSDRRPRSREVASDQPLGTAGRLGDGGGANARRDYPRGGASIRALDRRGPERRANRALDELGSEEQR